jgi:hypothetical protein
MPIIYLKIDRETMIAAVGLLGNILLLATLVLRA